MSAGVFFPLVRPALGRLWNSPYSKSFLAFVFFQILFLYGVRSRWWPSNTAHAGPESLQTVFFIMSVHLLVGINTLCFLRHAGPIVSSLQDLDELPEVERCEIKGAYDVFFWLLGVSAITCAIVPVLVILEWLAVIHHRYWNQIVSVSEIACLLLFIFFLIADFCCLNLCLRALRFPNCLSAPHRERVAGLARDLKLYIAAVDLPGFIGLLVIVLCSKALREFIPDMYWEGFIAGAIGLHVLFSQATLTLLSALDD